MCFKPPNEENSDKTCKIHKNLRGENEEGTQKAQKAQGADSFVLLVPFVFLLRPYFEISTIPTLFAPLEAI
jgi:hypothetical protein